MNLQIAYCYSFLFLRCSPDQPCKPHAPVLMQEELRPGEEELLRPGGEELLSPGEEELLRPGGEELLSPGEEELSLDPEGRSC